MSAPSIEALAPGWEQHLRELVARLDVPGAVLGVSHRGERVVATAGVAGLRNPQPVSADTVFQLGSISKVYTATLLLRLGGLEIIDRSAVEVVPDADWLDPRIRVRHLLTHSSGLGGDHFADTGRGDDALARYLAELRALPRDVPLAPGSRYSYCNSGYSVLGRLVEALTGRSYDAALRTHLLEPLGAHATSTLPEDTILSPVALGHNRSDHERRLRADEVWAFPRACNPLGGVCASVGDVLAFAELHLRDGRAAGGTSLLGDGVAALMRQRHLETPPLARPNARGLGWGIYDYDGGELVGHDGETLGQTATLRLLPTEQLAFVVLTNAIPDGDEITAELSDAVLSPWGIARPAIALSSGAQTACSDPTAGTDPAAGTDSTAGTDPAAGTDLTAGCDPPGFDPTPYIGRYRNLMATVDVNAADGGLAVTTHHTATGLEHTTEHTRLRPIGGGAFVDADVARPTRATRFGDPDRDGRCHSYFTGRIAWRIPRR